MRTLKHPFAITLLLSLLSAAIFAQNKDWLVKMQDPNVNFWELQKEFDDYWKDRTDTKGNGYKVFKRWEYINESRVLPNGKLLPPAHVKKEYARYMAENPMAESASGTWAIVGPTTYPSNNTGQPTGKGRVNAIAFHPTDVNTLFLGSPSGGIWKSVNGGANWTNLSANMPNLGVSAILIHPSNPNIIYLGTGDRDGGDAPGIGVYKSTDGGATWWPANNTMGDVTVGMLLMHPSDPNTILAATRSGIYKTTNGGSSWSLKQAGDFRDIKFKPGDPNTMYATRMITPSEYYRSTDNGNTWTLISTPTSGVGSRMVIGVSPANPASVYLVQIKSTDNTFKALLRSTDSGLTFTEQSNSPNIFGYNCDGSGTASQATYDLAIEVDRTNANIVYVGSINSWKSTDGGVNWSPISHWVGSNFAPGDPTANCAQSVHADHHWYEWSPLHSPTRLYLGHDGGIAYTADGGATWTEISNDMPTGQVYKIGQSTHTANTVIGGFQDNGISGTNNGGGSFTTIGGGDGFECQVDYSDPNYCYMESQRGNMRRSTTGVFGSYSNTFNGIVYDESAFSTPYMLHRTNPNTMFMGRTNMWRSTNIKASPAGAVLWDSLSTFAPGLTIRVIEQSPANLDILYMSRGTGGSSTLYRSDNVNAAANAVVWNVITKPGGQTPTDIAAHPADENTVYATAGMKVYKSTDKGLNWTDISGNLPALFINCLVLDVNANEGIYVGNQTGVWYKDATVANWLLFSSGLPPVDVRELEIYYDANPNNSRITAATYGRGVWQSDLIQVNVINPSSLAAVPYSAGQIDLAWTLNASNENVLIATSPTTTFGVPADGTAYTAGNSLPGGGTVVYVGNLTTFSHTGLTAGTNYCYKIWSVNGSNQYSAGLTPVCASTFSHNWTGNVNTDWFNTGNWGPGTIPTATDGAYIPAGRPFYPVINAAGATCYHLTIESGASVAMDAVTSYTLQVTGDWLNNGTFTRGAGTVAFTGTNALQTIKGAATTNFNILQVDKGGLDNILEATSPITLNAATNPLVLTSGTFKLSSASTITPFTSSTSIGSGAGLWNNGGTINAGNISWTLNGTALLRVSAGTVNVGTNAGNGITYLNNPSLILEGGALNIAGRLSPNSGTSTASYTQTGGTLTVNTVGSASTSRAPFELNSGVPFTLSGGTIAIRRHSANTSGDIMIASTTHNVTGGTLQIGDASTPAGQIIRINCTAPVYNLTVNATNAPEARLLTNNLTVKNDVTISGGTLNANNLNMSVGGHWTNNGTFTAGTGTVAFNGTANQNLAGSNATTFNNLTMNNAAGLILSGSVNTTVNGTLNLTSGVISTGANQVIVPASGSVARTSGHIFGNLQKNVAAGSNVSRTFEVGDAAATNYTPVALTFASVSTPGDLTAKTVSGDHPQIGSAALNASKSVNRYWSLTNSGTMFSMYDAVFNFLASDLDPSANTANLIAGKYDAPNWTYPTIGARTATSTEITGLSAFSDFQLAEQACVNPDIPVLAASVNPTCPGQPTTLSINSGNLNGAGNWQWYESSCGGTPVGTGASVSVSPTGATAYYARGEGGCIAAPGACGSLSISVHTSPTPVISGPSSVCSGGNVMLDAGSGYPSYLWSHSGGTGQTATYANVTATTTYTVQVTDANGCTGTAGKMVTVNGLPSVTCPGNSSVCVNAPAFALSGGSPAGGTYSGPGVSAGMFDPAAAGAGTHTITYAYTDGNNCTGSCTYSIAVNACTGISFTGTIKWEHDGTSGVNNATVNLSGAGTGSDLTDAAGDYLISIPSGSGNFTLKPVKNLNKLNGLTSADAVAVQQHLANIALLPAPFKRIAADVNKSNSISTLDALLINQVLLGNPSANTIFNTSWRFVPSSYTFPNPNAPWGFPEQINLTGVSSNVSGQDFKGIKLGDVVATWANPANFGAGEPLVWSVGDQTLQTGREFAAVFQAAQLDDLASFQFALRFDPEQVELTGIEPAPGSPLGAEHFGTFNLAEGEIRVVWSQAEGLSIAESSPLFHLRFKALKNGARLSETLWLDEETLPAYCYNSALAESKVRLEFGQATGTVRPGESTLRSFRNRPNPFSDYTVLEFSLSGETDAELRIIDAMGRLLYHERKTYSAGQHETRLQLTDSHGVLHAELITPYGARVLKLVAVQK